MFLRYRVLRFSFLHNLQFDLEALDEDLPSGGSAAKILFNYLFLYLFFAIFISYY